MLIVTIQASISKKYSNHFNTQVQFILTITQVSWHFTEQYVLVAPWPILKNSWYLKDCSAQINLYHKDGNQLFFLLRLHARQITDWLLGSLLVSQIAGISCVTNLLGPMSHCMFVTSVIENTHKILHTGLKYGALIFASPTYN